MAKATEAEKDADGLSQLTSEKSMKRLEQISSLRARGFSKDIDLPQLVVCGDQSAGKSSVLEGLSHIPFPRDEGVCTKFPTEVILEHTEGMMAITATIIPHVSRPDISKSKLQAFLRNIDDFTELPNVIADAGALMGLRGYGDNYDGPAFVEDVLSIKVTGQTGLHLSIVDLPGLIVTASEEQTEADVLTVQRMVDSYIEKPRTIILAVVQASNDIANQSIVKKSKQFDKAGQRTIGIITKPDLINKGAEGRIAALAKNEDTTRLQLGFFLLKNPAPEDLRNGITPEQRSAAELQYFQSSPWREQKLKSDRVGIEKLRVFLQKLLDQHVEKELPKVRDEIKAMIGNTERQILQLPAERPTLGHMRVFLSELAMQYHHLATAALSGDYHTSNVTFFDLGGNEIGLTRLRAKIHDVNTKFARRMRDKGQTLKQYDGGESYVTMPGAATIYSKKGKSSKTKAAVSPDPSENINDLSTTFESTRFPADNGWDRDGFLDASSGISNLDQQFVTEAQMKAWVKRTYIKTRGRELPGNYNHFLLTELFHHQSKNWSSIATDHLETVYDYIVAFVKKALAHLQIDDQMVAEIQERIDSQLQEIKELAEDELSKLCADERQNPITYNHYYTDNVQKSRLDFVQKIIERATHEVRAEDGPVEPSAPMHSDLLIAALREHVTVDMDEQACSEALAGLNAYYKVALKTFVDNVCKQVIERHLLRSLPNIFSPQAVAAYPDEELERIAGERQDVVETRARLREHLKNLKDGLNDLRK